MYIYIQVYKCLKHKDTVATDIHGSSFNSYTTKNLLQQNTTYPTEAIPYSPIGFPVWSRVAQYSASTRSFFGFSSHDFNSDTYWKQSIM